MRILESGKGELFRPPDPDAFREWNRRKSRRLDDKLMTEAEAVRRFVKDGDYLGTELYGTVRCPMSLVREVVRQGKGNLGVVDQSVMELELLIAAGLVKRIDITYIAQEVYGVSSILRRGVESGRVESCTEWSNGAISWRMKAAAMGVPFLPVRSMLGTDTLRHSAAKVVECPFTGLKLALLPALVLDVGMIHVHRADRHGNCQVDGISGFAVEMSRAAKRLIVSAEEIVPVEEIRRRPDRTAIPYWLVDAVVHAPFGSHPGEMVYAYGRDEEAIRRFIDASATEEGTRAYLAEWVTGPKDHREYLDRVGRERLAAMVEAREGRP